MVKVPSAEAVRSSRTRKAAMMRTKAMRRRKRVDAPFVNGPFSAKQAPEEYFCNATSPT